MPGEPNETCFDEFVAAREQFEKLMGELRSESARSLGHGGSRIIDRARRK